MEVSLIIALFLRFARAGATLKNGAEELLITCGKPVEKYVHNHSKMLIIPIVKI